MIFKGCNKIGIKNKSIKKSRKKNMIIIIEVYKKYDLNN
tara:strand:- start:65 stop:181 length:117 start_codon:yes stop_codon:yes gene_type:complete